MIEEYTPMMQAYLKTKEEYKDAILFYRLGDFYEMFFEDAKIASKELEIALTGKNCGTKERAPMCGVPFHAAESFISKLTERGYKVAICEQVEDPKLAKGIVKREVVRVVTPGTSFDVLNDESVYLCALINIGDEFGVAYSDISTGEFIINSNCDLEKTKEILFKIHPNELILNESAIIYKSAYENFLKNKSVIFKIKELIDNKEKAECILFEQFNNLTQRDNLNFSLGMLAGANLINYLHETQKSKLSHIRKITYLDDKDSLKIDTFTFRNLELLEPMRRDDNKGSLFYCLDKTDTAMGRRLLKSYIRNPLCNSEKINNRLDAIEDFIKDPLLAEELREMLKGIYDLERLITRVSFKNANPREILSLKNSIKDLNHIKILLSDLESSDIKSIAKELDPLTDIYNLIENAIDIDAPVSAHDADIIKRGFNESCDKLKEASLNGKSLLNDLENKERERTGINKIRIKYNRVFGYFIEVTNSQLNLVPEYYIRRQTLANCERFFTTELKELEDTILGAKEKLNRLEFELYSNILDTIYENIPRIQKTAYLIAKLDVYLSFAKVSVKNRYSRPILNNDNTIEISKGRHPVVEMMQKDIPFIENDCKLDDDNMIYLITGPNMAGKSTYMRQCALIVLMAHMGCFVPAEYANICIIDRLFTRVGASDDLSSGQSTFMVEMNELAYILKHATKNSFIILDEIGRGTSTYDGLSIAWSVTEYIANHIKAKTLFATHYHELSELEVKLKGVKNYSCAVKEENDNIIFLRKIINKAADRSYGIQVALLAGVPQEIIQRAKDVLDNISSDKNNSTEKQDMQLSFFDMPVISSDKKAKEIVNRLDSFDTDNTTPIDALNFINELKKELNK